MKHPPRAILCRQYGLKSDSGTDGVCTDNALLTYHACRRPPVLRLDVGPPQRGHQIRYFCRRGPVRYLEQCEPKHICYLHLDRARVNHVLW